MLCRWVLFSAIAYACSFLSLLNRVYLTICSVLIEGDAAGAAEEEKDKGPSWVTVYTDYGYGTVDAVKFKQMMEECQAAHELAQQPILEYFKTQYAELKAKHE